MRKKKSWMQRLFYWICWLFSSQCFVSRNYQKLVTEEKRSQPREKDRWINLMKSSNEIQFSHLFLNCERKKKPRKTINFLHERTNFSTDIIAKCIGIQLLKWHDCIWRFFIEMKGTVNKALAGQSVLLSRSTPKQNPKLNSLWFTCSCYSVPDSFGEGWLNTLSFFCGQSARMSLPNLFCDMSNLLFSSYVLLNEKLTLHMQI